MSAGGGGTAVDDAPWAPDPSETGATTSAELSPTDAALSERSAAEAGTAVSGMGDPGTAAREAVDEGLASNGTALPVESDSIESVAARSRGQVARGAAIGLARHLGAIALFALPAVAMWWHAWDGHLGNTLSCTCGDAGQQVWFIAWPAYALAHGLDPFRSAVLNAPHGVNLLDSTSSPLVGMALAPVTWIFGPIVSTNLALTLAPALTAWSAWVAARHFVAWRPAAWIAGLTFGYTPFVVTNVETGHVMLALDFTLPLLLVVGHEILVLQRRSPWRMGLALGLLVTAQFFISTEVLVIGATVAVLAGAAALALYPVRLARGWWYTVRAVGLAGVLAGALLAWPAWLALAGPQHIAGSPWPGIQIEDNAVYSLWNAGPYKSFLILVHADGYEGWLGPSAVFLGYAVLAALAASVVLGLRRRLTWLLVAVGLTTFWLSMGLVVEVSAGHFDQGFPLPWRTIGTWPLLNDVGPLRFTLFLDLFVALLLAVGVDTLWRLINGRVGWPAWLRRLSGAGAGAGAGADGAGADSAGAAEAGAGAGIGGADLTLGQAESAAVAETMPAASATTDPPPAPPASPQSGWIGWTRRWLGGVVILAAVLVAFIPVVETYQVPLVTRGVSQPPWYATVGRSLPRGTVLLTYPFPTTADAVASPMVWQAEDDMNFSLVGGYLKIRGPGGSALINPPPNSAFGMLITLSEFAYIPYLAPTPAQISTMRRAIVSWGAQYVVVTESPGAPVAAAFFTAVLGRLPTSANSAWVWNLSHNRRVLPSPKAASLAFAPCGSTASRMVITHVSRPSQAADRCVMAHLPPA